MKIIFSLLAIFSMPFLGIAQKKQVKKSKKVNQTEVVQEAFPTIEANSLDTLYINAGKSYAFLIDVNKYSDGAQTIGSILDEEEKELQKNFSASGLEIIKISKYTFILFENKQTLDISGEGNSFQAFAFWSGKMDEDVKVREGTRMVTEFVAEQMGLEKESSYIVNARKYKVEVAALQNKNKITEKSKIVMAYFLDEMSGAIQDEDGNYGNLFIREKLKIKNIETYFLKQNKTKVLIKSISLNENGLPNSKTEYDSEGKKNGVTNYKYENGLLTQMINNDGKITSVRYNDDQMILTHNVGEADETTLLWMDKGELLEKNYVLAIDDHHTDMNTFVEERLENNCKSRYINDTKWSENCSSEKNVFPYIHTYTSYQEGEVLQYRKIKIEKRSEKTFEKYYSTAEQLGEKDDYQLGGTFQLNDKKLVKSISFSKGNENRVIMIDYTYYP
jgi:hypothetical protein